MGRLLKYRLSVNGGYTLTLRNRAEWGKRLSIGGSPNPDTNRRRFLLAMTQAVIDEALLLAAEASLHVETRPAFVPEVSSSATVIRPATAALRRSTGPLDGFIQQSQRPRKRPTLARVDVPESLIPIIHQALTVSSQVLSSGEPLERHFEDLVQWARATDVVFVADESHLCLDTLRDKFHSCKNSSVTSAGVYQEPRSFFSFLANFMFETRLSCVWAGTHMRIGDVSLVAYARNIVRSRKQVVLFKN